MRKSIILLIGYLLLFGLPTNMKALEIYAHRGTAAFWPENTLLSFENSLKLGVDNLDIDVSLTKDNIVVGSHDPFLNKDITTDKDGNWLTNNNILISSLTFAELLLYDVGQVRPKSKYATNFPLRKEFAHVKIPSLDQVIDLIKTRGNGRNKLQIEIKTSPRKDDDQYIEKFVQILIHTLEKNNFIERAEIQSFDWRNLILAKKLNPNIKTSFITEQSYSFNTFAHPWFYGNVSWTAGYRLKNFENSIIKMIKELGGDNWCPLYKNVTKDLVDEARKNNIRVVPWTADTKEEMLALIDAGVDGIITNRTDILREVMASKNWSLPV